MFVCREFDIVESEAEDAETDSDGSEEDSDGASQPGSSSERKKSARAERTGKKSSSAKTKAAKAKAKAAKAKAKVQKATKPKPPKPPKQPKPPKPPKEPKQPKPADLLQDSARRFGDDLFSTDDGTVGEPGEATAAAVKLTPDELGDASLMELRECLHRFKTAASTTSFSPGKFPSALRPLLDESVCAVLRAFKPTCAEPLPVGLCPALASFLPFSVPALTKLLRKKILRALKESIEGEHLTRMYGSWPQLVIKRLAEENSIAGKCCKQECSILFIVSGFAFDSGFVSVFACFVSFCFYFYFYFYFFYVNFFYYFCIFYFYF